MMTDEWGMGQVWEGEQWFALLRDRQDIHPVCIASASHWLLTNH